MQGFLVLLAFAASANGFIYSMNYQLQSSQSAMSLTEVRESWRRGANSHPLCWDTLGLFPPYPPIPL
jgi:hypothetical protein